jgi:hypothetical protein
MRLARIGFAIWLISAVGAAAAGDARAQAPTNDPRASSEGYIGRRIPRLEIDDCPAIDPTTSQDQLRKQAAELYARGETLYAQGDYAGSVRELISGYCLIPFYSLLKDIGLSYERNLDYEKAIGYFERYVRAMPPDAKRTSACAPDPQEDKEQVKRRVEILQRLRAHILVETEPRGADITIANEAGIAGRAKSGQPIEVPGGHYDMTVERTGYETYTQAIDVTIGKPFSYFVGLRPQKGRLSVQVSPGDAKVYLRDSAVERFAGIGRVDEQLPSGNYTLISEAPGRLRDERPIEVIEKQTTRLQIELAPKPQFARRQLILFAAIGGGLSTGGLLYAFNDTGIAALGSLGGIAAGAVGSYLYLPDQVPLGTSNLTITASLIGTIAGTTTTYLLTTDQAKVQPFQGAGTILGAGIGYYVGQRTKIDPGDAALINTAAFWGTAAGGLFVLSFQADRKVGAGLVLSGLGLGTVGGVLLTRYFDISRTHALLLDIGGLVGVIGGLAAESQAYPGGDSNDRINNHVANFALGGMAVGLITAGILTRNLDAPKIPVKPALGTAVSSDGSSTTTYGLAGSW